MVRRDYLEPSPLTHVMRNRRNKKTVIIKLKLAPERHRRVFYLLKHMTETYYATDATDEREKKTIMPNSPWQDERREGEG